MSAELQAAMRRLAYVARDEEIPAGLAAGANLSDDLAAVLAALSTPPADDMHAHNVSELLAEARELVASWDLKGSWTSESPIGLVTRLAAALELASAPPRRVVTPPAEDVREALAEEARDSVDRIGGWKHLRKFSGMSAEWMDVLRDAIICRVADALGEVRPRGTVTPTPEEWAAQMDAERARQVEHGYDDAHDAQHGAAHLLNWAIDYARRGNNLAAATMARCAVRLPHGSVTDAEVERAAKHLWIIAQDDEKWARSVVDDVFSAADDWPAEALEAAEIARGALEAARGDRS